mmetsp:Transcript_93770/g.270948  ORF Transcript_93770/g.270948 Transcript_93770/m.270948 type:complete len:632 (-) Transcript_93770:44-1939(-)
MDLGFAAAPEGEGDWGDEDEAEAEVGRGLELAVLPPGAAPAPEASPEPERSQDRHAPLPAMDKGSAAERAHGAKRDGAVKRLMPISKIHSNPRTRYFVIKSSNHKNLVLSVENNVWATQRHNEEKLNEALQNAPHVILLFSVNMSGCFQGYAKMMGAVGSSAKTHVFRGFGRAFDVRWLRLDDLDFREVSDINNPWNDNKSVKISRDGQELPHDVGRRVCERVDEKVWRADPDTYVTDEKEVETGGFAPVAPLAGGPLLALPPMSPLHGEGRLGEGITPGAWAPPVGPPACGMGAAPPCAAGPWPVQAWCTPGFIHPAAMQNPWAERSSSYSYSYSSSSSCSDAEDDPRKVGTPDGRRRRNAAPAGFNGAAPVAPRVSPFESGEAAVAPAASPSAFEPPPLVEAPAEFAPAAPRRVKDRSPNRGRRRRAEAVVSAAADSGRRRRREEVAGAAAAAAAACEERQRVGKSRKSKDKVKEAKHRRKSGRDAGAPAQADARDGRRDAAHKARKEKGKSKKDPGGRRRESDTGKAAENGKVKRPSDRRRRRDDAAAAVAGAALVDEAQAEKRTRREKRSRSRRRRRDREGQCQVHAAPPSDWRGAQGPGAWQGHSGPPPGHVPLAPSGLQADAVFQ